MQKQIQKKLESEPIVASAPCRIDMGGTLDIAIFSYPLRHLAPCTFNIALRLRTRVRLLPFTRGKIKISSRGFKDASRPASLVQSTHAEEPAVQKRVGWVQLLQGVISRPRRGPSVQEKGG